MTMLKIKKNPIQDDFVINDEVLGIGISGKVITCVNKLNLKKYALKCLKDSPKAMREIDLHWRASQGCQYIVKIHSVYENQIGSHKQYLIVMEYMEGGELFGKITKRTKPFTENEVAKIMFQICSAVKHLHSMNIAHRDLKPENLLLTSNDENALIKLIDFGFAKEVISGLQTPCYTPYYVAPEIFDKQKYDQSCDIWSLGVIMYILCSGYPPFFSSNGEPISPGMKRRIRSGQYGFPDSEWSTVSNDAKELISGMLKTDPKQRSTIDDIMRSKYISNFLEVPNTPLPSLDIIREDEDGWKEVQQHTVRAIDEMRRNYDEIPTIQELDQTKNSLLEKRKNKMNSENATSNNSNDNNDNKNNESSTK